MTAQSEVGLREVREDEVDTLKERLARYLPHSFFVHGPVSLAARYGLNALHPASILVPTCPRPSCFTVITSIPPSVRPSLSVFWRLEEHSARDVAQYLSYLPDLDWSQSDIVVTLPTILLPSLQSLDSVGGKRIRVQTTFSGHLYNLQAPVLLDTELPPVYHATRLREEDASVVWKHWDQNQFVPKDSVRHDIVHFPSVGIRERSSQGEGEETLVSWIRMSLIGWMGNTFTLPQHRRRGLASVATATLARQLLQEGLLAYVCIEKNNIASIKFHEILGFKRQCAIVFAVLLPAEVTDQDHL